MIPQSQLYKWPWKAKWALARSVYSQVVRGKPGTIYVEVSTHCNRRCSYCPQSVKPAKVQTITDDMWSMVRRRLEQLNARCFVGLTHFNELALVPNSDRYVRDVSLLGYAVRLFTNGDFPDAIRRWVDAGATQILITRHQPTRTEWLTKLGDLPDHPAVKVRELFLENLDHRAGWVQVPFTPLTSCRAPDVFNIRIDGTVSICCLDYGHETNLGNITESSIMDIWNGEQYRTARATVRGGKPSSKLCEACFNGNHR